MKILRFWGKTLVIVDVSNVYTTYAKYKRIFKFEDYFNFILQLVENLESNYKKIKKENIYLFLGVDKNLKKSIWFYEEIKKIYGKNVVSKQVKYFTINGRLTRKADLDADIGFYIGKLKNNFTSFLILSSDGDFAGIYRQLLEEGKQVVVLHGYITEKVTRSKNKLKHYNVGKEILDLQNKFKGKIRVSPMDILFNQKSR